MPHERRKARRARQKRPTKDAKKVIEDGGGKVIEDGGGKVIEDGVDQVIQEAGELAIQDGVDQAIQDSGEIAFQDGVDQVIRQAGEIAIQDGGGEAVDRMPPEMWIRILSLLEFYPNAQMINKRLVCKAWRDVIDEHMVFQVTLNDQKSDPGTAMSHIRAKSCVVVSLLKPILPHQLILVEPEELTKLFLWGPISLNNMMYVARRFVNVNNLHFNQAAFAFGSPNENFLITTSEQDSNTLTNWFGRLEKLELAGIQLTRNEYPYGNRSYQNLLRREMPMLKSFCIEVDARRTNYYSSIDEVILFTARNPTINLLSLKMLSEDHAHTMNVELNHRYRIIQLEILRLHLDCPVEFRRFIPLIRRQNHLKELRVRFGVPSCCLPNLPRHLELIEWNEILQSLDKTIRMNNLVSLEIYHFQVQIRTSLNMASLQGLRNLKKLVLRKTNQDHVQHSEAINLALLPDSLECLKLTNLTCATNDLELLFQNTPHLKCVELNPAGEFQGFGIYPNGLRSLMRKTTMKTITLRHLDYRRFDVQLLNGKHYIMLDGFMIHIQEYHSHDYHDCCSLDVVLNNLV